MATLLRLHDLERDVDRATAGLDGGLALLLYTFNKASDLDRTLAGLSRADLSFAPGTRIVVLDNGSTDATPDVLAAWADRLGPDLFERVDLPVNIGAPAARNWLMRHPRVTGSAWAAYLDDDADLPRTSSAGSPPRSGPIRGRRLRLPRVDAGNPSHIQSADFFLEPIPAVPGAPPFSRAFETSRGHLHSLDMGRFAYLRPCASVTAAAICSPRGPCSRWGISTYVSRPPSTTTWSTTCAACSTSASGLPGHLRVGHRKMTGSQGRPGGRHYVAGFANQFKLHNFYSEEEFAAMARYAYEAAFRDAGEKWTWLAQRQGGGEGPPERPGQ